MPSDTTLVQHACYHPTWQLIWARVWPGPQGVCLSLPTISAKRRVNRHASAAIRLSASAALASPFRRIPPCERATVSSHRRSVNQLTPWGAALSGAPRSPPGHADAQLTCWSFASWRPHLPLAPADTAGGQRPVSWSGLPRDVASPIMAGS